MGPSGEEVGPKLVRLATPAVGASRARLVLERIRSRPADTKLGRVIEPLWS
jgi:hypothetical protein